MVAIWGNKISSWCEEKKQKGFRILFLKFHEDSESWNSFKIGYILDTNIYLNKLLD